MRLGYVILYVPDVARAVAFYGRAFGLAHRFTHESGAYAEMATGATALAFSSEAIANGLNTVPQRPGQRPPAFELALVTEDVPTAVMRATEAGAMLVRDAERKPWGQIVAYVRDLNGVLVELCSPAVSSKEHPERATSREQANGN